ncbi:MAG: response regulator, partial [Verrucomicrobiales bacterium]|nr:response regulator [Verrucomicrobiales bacterium]
VMMPGMNGIEVAKKIAENFGEQRTGIIILSSAAHTLSREEMAELKIEKILRKPVKQSDLLDAVTKHYGATRTENIEQPKVRNRKTSETNQPLKILVAEDGAINRIVAVNLLESKGHTVSTAEDGAIAVKKFQEEDFDAILMDVMMPNLDGYGATTAIREIENRTGGHIPIIAMTANAMNGDRNRCLEAGMDGYVAKPFRPEELFATLESAV